MKRAIILLVLAACVQLVAQDRSTITVKKSDVSKETVLVTAMQQGDQAKALELNCNRDASSCKAPEPGTYIMVRLPKNWGIYDCSNVDLYAATADPDKDQKVGEYCLGTK